MGIREELNQALQVDNLPSSWLLPRTMMRLDESAPASKRWQAVAGVAAVLLAGVVVGVIRFAHVGHRPVQPAVTSQAAVSLPSAQEGFLAYRFVSAQVGWVSAFRSDGRTVVAKTSDGGKHWEHLLEVDGLGPGTPALFLDASVAIIAGQQNGLGFTFPPAIWMTTDGGEHWDMRAAPPDSGSLMSVDFIDAEHGWLWMSEGFLYQTIDGGRHWTSVASSETSPALVGSEVKPELKFVSPTVGWIINSPSRNAGGALYGTRDGGRTWGLENRPAAGVGVPGSRIIMGLPTLFNEHVGMVLVTVTSSSSIACPSPAPSGMTTTCFQPFGTYVSVTGDGGQTWSPPRRIMVDGAVSFIDDRHWIARGANGISTSTDAGVSWSANRPLPQLPAGWGPSLLQMRDLRQGWISLKDWSGGRLALLAVGAAGSKGPFNLHIQGTPPKFALLETDDGGAHWTEVQLAGID
ncbi:MAG: hypothetical protein E6J01_15685 [Chloroflexi bacterium]|nr:MAG: hypothetical protein E6J01_15685 [Chloroflexota bacterium]